MQGVPDESSNREEKRVRIITLHADQQFLYSLYEFPVNYPFSASVIRNVYIRGGTRRNPKDPRAKRPPGHTRLGKASLKKILTVTSGEVLEQAAEDEDELNEKISSTDINNVRYQIINTRLINNKVIFNTSKEIMRAN